MKRLLLISFVLWGVLSLPAIADEINDSAGESGAKFLRIPAGARASGMGEAFSAVANDASGLYWNPAGLVQSRTMSVTVSHYEWFQDIRYNFLGFTRPLANKTYVGVFGGGLYTSDIEGRLSYNDDVNEFGSGDFVFGASVGQYFGGGFSAGLSLKGIYQTIDEYSATGFAADMGFLYQPISALKLGLTIQHLGSEMKFESESDPLPTTTRGGFAYSLLNHQLTFAGDIEFPNDNDMRLYGGVEYWLQNMFALRAGYKYKSEGTDALGDNTGYTAGVGFRTGGMVFDYAYAPYGNLGDTHRISLSFDFGYFPPTAPRKEESTKTESLPPVTPPPIADKDEDIIEQPIPPSDVEIRIEEEQAAQEIYNAGRFEFDREQFDAAQEFFERILDEYPHTSKTDKALYMTGQCYFEQGEYQTAFSYFERVIRDTRQLDMDADAQLMIGYCHYFQQQYQAARDAFRLVIDKYPQSRAVKGGEAEHWLQKSERFLR